MRLAASCSKSKLKKAMKHTLKAFLLFLALGTSFGMGAPETSFFLKGKVVDEASRKGLGSVTITLKLSKVSTVTASDGTFEIVAKTANDVLLLTSPGYRSKEVAIAGRSYIEIKLAADPHFLQPEEAVMDMAASPAYEKSAKTRATHTGAYFRESVIVHNTENYAAIQENIFHRPADEPLSTFSIDVDAASYSNVRRFLTQGQRPPVDAVRVEEMINYFDYEYPQPKGEDPFSINTEVAQAPWNPQHHLVHIGLQGKAIPTENLPPSNLVFLIDVSGSMSDANKLPLLKSSFKLLVNQLRPVDKVAIVVYAGAAGLVLPATPGDKKDIIVEALNKLEAGGSTAGGAGIQLAYMVAKENFVEGGNNRVIIATDGDFNVGESSDAGMERLIEEKRKDGIFLTVLGYGMGNYKDSKMEILADKGNGNYAYIDNILEAKKVLVNEFGGTLFTIARDVKIQVEFNPAKVQAYRLVGYENRLLNKEDFNDDRKDAGELGSGHTVTALYEIIPVGIKSNFVPVDPLKYQQYTPSEGAKSDELMTVKLRYKQPEGDASKLLTAVIQDSPEARQSENFQWSAAVAGFGMLLRDSEFKGEMTYDKVLSLATAARGDDKNGYRTEFINLVRSAMLLN